MVTVTSESTLEQQVYLGGVRPFLEVCDGES